MPDQYEKIIACCEKYLGNFSIPPTEFLLDYMDIANNLQLIVSRPFSGDFYNQSELERSIKTIEDCLVKIDEELTLLPHSTYEEVEHLAFDRMNNTQVILRHYIDETDEEYKENFLPQLNHRMQRNPISTFTSYLTFLTQVRQYNSRLNRWETKPSIFSDALKNVKPIRDISHGRSKKRIIKVRIVDVLRNIWKLQLGKEAPKTLPYEGNKFGDFVKEVFKILEIKADERSAINAWFEEIGKNQEREIQS